MSLKTIPCFGKLGTSRIPGMQASERINSHGREASGSAEIVNGRPIGEEIRSSRAASSRSSGRERLLPTVRCDPDADAGIARVGAGRNGAAILPALFRGAGRRSCRAPGGNSALRSLVVVFAYSARQRLHVGKLKSRICAPDVPLERRLPSGTPPFTFRSDGSWAARSSQPCVFFSRWCGRPSPSKGAVIARPVSTFRRSLSDSFSRPLFSRCAVTRSDVVH